MVEDNEINREIMSSQLSSLGCQVDPAVNGKDAFQRYADGDYDVVLTDIDMPEMDGYELVEKIRNSPKDTGRPIPVFAITASDFDLTEERARAMGFSGYMLKPLDLDVLLQKLAGMLPDR